MNQYTHRTIIVPAPFQQLAQALCEAAAEGDAGKGMFTTGLSETGTEPATHYISSGYIFDDFAAMLPLQADGVVVSPDMPDYVASAAALAGLSVTPEQVAGLYALADVTEQDPHAAMERLGLQLVTGDV